jgi:hypothetical protein
LSGWAAAVGYALSFFAYGDGGTTLALTTIIFWVSFCSCAPAALFILPLLALIGISLHVERLPDSSKLTKVVVVGASGLIAAPLSALGAPLSMYFIHNFEVVCCLGLGTAFTLPIFIGYLFAEYT